MIKDFMSLNRLRKARILICGMNSLGNEVAKNIVLAGVEHMTVLDNTILTEDEKKIQFLPSTSGIGQNVSFVCLILNLLVCMTSQIHLQVL